MTLIKALANNLRVQDGHSRGKTLRKGFYILRVAVVNEPLVLIGALACSVLTGAMTVVSASLMGWITDHVLLPDFVEGYGNVTAARLQDVVLVLAATALLTAASTVGRRFLGGIMMFRLQARTRRALAAHYLAVPLTWIRDRSPGILLSYAGADVEATWWTLWNLPMSLAALVMLTCGILSILAVSPVLAWVSMVVLPCVALLNAAYQRRVGVLSSRVQELRGQISEMAHESIEGAALVKTLGREDDEIRRLAVVADELRAANAGVGRVRGLFDAMLDAVPRMGLLLVLLVGASEVARGNLQPGALVQVSYLFTLLAVPVRFIGWVLGDIPRSVSGWQRIQGVVSAPVPPDEPAPAGEGRSWLSSTHAAQLEVRNVSFTYADGNRALDRVSFSVRPGQTAAIVGPTGSGKSTLVHLLAALDHPQDGAVLIDDTDLRSLDRRSLARDLAVVPQQTFLFKRSVRENLALARETRDEEIWECLRLAQADAFVAALPDGLDSRLGESGMSLSGGQRQRLALARALLRRPRLLILDDATSSLDTEVEGAVLAGLRGARLPCTTVIVTHRKAAVSHADSVIFLSQGRIQARGAHSELLIHSPDYREFMSAYARTAGTG